MALGPRALREVSRTGNGKGCGWLFMGMAVLMLGALIFGAVASTCVG